MSEEFIFDGTLAELDPQLEDLLNREEQRQQETIILIPSESISPPAVREAMGSAFTNIYAEGYPREESRAQNEAEILDYERELAHYRRYGDPRYYKGVEYANLLEALARRRAAELFAANGLGADRLFVNVQPLSGAPANNAVYHALLQPGDTILGMDLNAGGHLTHGSPVNRSGKLYNAVAYGVDRESGRIDYDAVQRQAEEVRPKLIIAGYSAYPFQVDWQRFREIANSVGAYLLADISHISGLVASGVHPSPIGIADVVTTTTHKSLCGPRGALIITHRADLGRKLDRAVFPGEQGGPHMNNIAAMALAFKLACTPQFRALQERVVANARRLAEKLQERGLVVVGGGSETHLLLLDARRSIVNDGVGLSGDMAARILDLAGIVTNRNTIAGDTSAFAASGVRLGTVWISQLGYGPAEVDRLAEAMATLLHGVRPCTYAALGGKELLRAKVSYDALQQARAIVRELAGIAEPEPQHDSLMVRGETARDFLDLALSSDVLGLAVGESQPAHLFGGDLDAPANLLRTAEDAYVLRFADAATAAAAGEWLRALSDGFVDFGDLYAKLPGPVAVTSAPAAEEIAEPARTDAAIVATKPFFVGHERSGAEAEPLPPFTWAEPEDPPLKRTKLYEAHVAMGAKMVPFAGWEMPVWYTSVSEEHAAVRQTAGLFDVSHMGVLEASGPYAASFLNLVTTNDVDALEVGQSHYSQFLFPDGSVVDDLLVYKRAPQTYMLVVNASNNDKDWAWLNAVNEGRVLIDEKRPWVKVEHPAVLRDLRDPQWGDEQRVDLALQGPRSRDILLALCDDGELAARIKKLPWAGLTEGKLGGFDVVISRTGYTGERVAYELFVHPDATPAFWQKLLEAGEPFGLKPIGLAARDSTRTEAGLPLYGHEMAGQLGLNPAEAGFGSFAKLWKPFFVGREAFIAVEEKRNRMVTRFRMNEKAVRRPELGDPVLDRRGKIIGTVTSCAIDQDGYLLGQAVLPLEFLEPGTPIAIYQLGGGARSLKLPTSLDVGQRMPVPDGATVLTRFPTRK